uniref:Uncharacterized protein n=1 Tax=Spermophilus dauricus TaxID=99837 RepID=A0A8C9UV89_SPEDA
MLCRLRKAWKLCNQVRQGQDSVSKHGKPTRGWDNADGVHHHRISFDKDHLSFFAEVGMRHYHLKRNQSLLNCQS